TSRRTIYVKASTTRSSRSALSKGPQKQDPWHRDRTNYVKASTTRSPRSALSKSPQKQDSWRRDRTNHKRSRTYVVHTRSPDENRSYPKDMLWHYRI
ncbi:hypothetical protein LSAT2_013561, partial [Lamellibrachia satsuma]